jgi:hypothetical protein
MQVFESRLLSQVGINIAITTKKFGNMRFSDLSIDMLSQKLNLLRKLTNFQGNIIAPKPNHGNRIFHPCLDKTNHICEGFYRQAANEEFDGAIIGSDLAFQNYALASADCPLGILWGYNNAKSSLTIMCLHLSLASLQSGILQKAIQTAEMEIKNIKGFYYGFGIGPDSYTFNLKDNIKLFNWLKSHGIQTDNQSDFKLDLFEICTKLLKQQTKFKGEIIKESLFVCTSSAKFDNDYLFFSHRRGDANLRHCLLVNCNQ